MFGVDVFVQVGQIKSEVRFGTIWIHPEFKLSCAHGQADETCISLLSSVVSSLPAAVSCERKRRLHRLTHENTKT